jgi:diguanylate cyclase (GGDEF)-like protein/PAS domain S-box-containing protein
MGTALQREIESHKGTSEALRQSEETVRALLNATTETALLIDTEGCILALNDTAFERLGRLSPVPVGDSPDALLGANVFDLFPQELAAARRARNELVIESGKPARFEDERNGRWMDNTIYPICDPQGNVVKLAIFSYDITERKWTEQALQRALLEEQERARRDPLTGVLNHGAIVEELEKLVRVASDGPHHAVAMVDVDGLKAVNDNHGHRMGDAVLVAVAHCLIVDGVTVGRYGGDEFIAILPGSGYERAERYRAEAIERLASTEVTDEDESIVLNVSASIGLALHAVDHDAVPKLIELADARMYAMKRQRPIVRPRITL